MSLQAITNFVKLPSSLNGFSPSWILYLIGTAILFSFAIVDYRTYKFYPLEAGIFIDISGRS